MNPINARDENLADIKRENIENESFGNFLKRHGLMPPDAMGYDEDSIR